MTVGTRSTPACNGHGCLLRGQCARYKPVIDFAKDISFSLAPVKYENGHPTCEFFIIKPKTDAEERDANI